MQRKASKDALVPKAVMLGVSLAMVSALVGGVATTANCYDLSPCIEEGATYSSVGSHVKLDGSEIRYIGGNDFLVGDEKRGMYEGGIYRIEVPGENGPVNYSITIKGIEDKEGV